MAFIGRSLVTQYSDILFSPLLESGITHTLSSALLESGITHTLDKIEQDHAEESKRMARSVQRPGYIMCYLEFGVCLSITAMHALQDQSVEELEVLDMVGKGLAEYYRTGDIANTWVSLRQIEHVVLTEKCIRKFKICQ